MQGKTVAYDVFISYSRRDKRTFTEIRDLLTAVGLVVWTDESLTPGTPSWKDAIEDAIEGARSLVVILSPDSKDSAWVEREIEYAMHHNLPIFPVLVRGDVRSAVPFELSGMQWADVRRDFYGGMEPLVAAITDCLAIKNQWYRLHEAGNGRRARRARHVLASLALIAGILVTLLTTRPDSQSAAHDTESDAPATFPQAGADDPGIHLVYNGWGLALVNATAATVNAADLYFVQGGHVLFSADDWRSGVDAPEQLRSGACFHVWDRNHGFLESPPCCDTRQAWFEVAAWRVFWLAAFEVWRGDRLLATCPAAHPDEASVCALPLR